MKYIPLTYREVSWGSRYLLFSLLVLPSLLQTLSVSLGSPLTDLSRNFLYFLINLLAGLWIFQNLLTQSAKRIPERWKDLCLTAVLGTAGYFACSWMLEFAIVRMVPGFTNANDGSIAQLARENLLLTFLGTVILVPPFEECMYRGLIFGLLRQRAPKLALPVSALIFALIHVVGYVGVYSPLALGIAVVQYLPAGFFLGWAYQKSGTLFSPILIHAIINAIGIIRMA